MSNRIFKQDLMNFLESKSEITNILGGSPNTKIYAEYAPKNIHNPYSVYHTISYDSSLSHNGPDNFFTIRLQFDCIASSPDPAERLADAFEEVLSGLSQKIGATSTTQVWSCNIDNRLTFWEDTLQSSVCSCDFIFEFSKV